MQIKNKFILYNMDISKEFSTDNLNREEIEITEVFSPDITAIMEEIYSFQSPIELITYLQNINWSDIFKLFLPDNIDDRDNLVSLYSQQIIDGINDQLVKYNNETSGKRASSLFSYNTKYSQELKEHIMNYLAERGITYKKAKEDRDNTIDILKNKLRYHIQYTKGIKPFLYDMQIDEFKDEIKIQMKYTELGALIMWKSEIPHDLSQLEGKIISLIDKKTREYTKKLNDMHEVNDKTVSYTENTARELCLDILNYMVIPRCVERHGKTELQIGSSELGHGILPSIYNETNVIITSDANNTGNVEFSQVLRTGLYNITGKVVPFLNIDAGSAPTQIGFQESMQEQEQLEKLKENPRMMGLNKPIDITIYSPTGINMLHIKTTPNDLTQYNIEIYSENGKDVHLYEKTINNLSITNVINIVHSVPTKFQFHAALLKSLGDLIPYQTVCLQSALINDVKAVNIMGSIDYSMIFQLLGNVTYFKDEQNVTCKLNQRRILTGVNLENSNVYFPWSSTEKHVYQLLLYIYGLDTDDNSFEIENFIKVKNTVYTILYNYAHENKMPINVVNNFLMNMCIADLNECSTLIKNYPNSNSLIQELEISIQPLTNITNLKYENINKYIQNKRDDIFDDGQFSVNFDNLDYILAYIIARKSMLPSPTVFNISSSAEKRKTNDSPKTIKRKRVRGSGKRKKTLRKK